MSQRDWEWLARRAQGRADIPGKKQHVQYRQQESTAIGPRRTSECGSGPWRRDGGWGDTREAGMARPEALAGLQKTACYLETIPGWKERICSLT